VLGHDQTCDLLSVLGGSFLACLGVHIEREAELLRNARERLFVERVMILALLRALASMRHISGLSRLCRLAPLPSALLFL
jgi:hypothetical protein